MFALALREGKQRTPADEVQRRVDQALRLVEPDSFPARPAVGRAATQI
jgi:hypothetical protein